MEPVPKRFVENRQRLDLLISSLGSFSKKELFDAFAANGADVVFDSQDTVGDLLKSLVQAGTLKCEYGRYSHPPRF